MNIRFWGTRGSLPSPGPSTVRYGGNTSCVEARLSDGSLVILDAGTGIRPLGASLGVCEGTLLLTHYHWDHIQGLPFFAPAYNPQCRLRVFGPMENGMSPDDLLEAQMVTPYFPAVPAQLKGIMRYQVTPDEPFTVGAATVRTSPVCHPNGAVAYRIEDAGVTLVYMCDDEVDSAPPRLLEQMLDLAQGADVLIHDCQYTESEYAERHGWGHSTPRQAVKLAVAAGVRQLILFHHDPGHSDEQVEALAEEAQALAGGLYITIAREGETMLLAPQQGRVGAEAQRSAPRRARSVR